MKKTQVFVLILHFEEGIGKEETTQSRIDGHGAPLIVVYVLLTKFFFGHFRLRGIGWGISHC
jgi:hypothetical protein